VVVHWQLVGFSKAYGTKWAVSDLHFDLHGGHCLALLGPNGSGKSTTLRTLVTLQKPDSGQFLHRSNDFFQRPEELRPLLGYLAQEVALDKTLTAEETMRFHAGLHHLPWREAAPRAQNLLSLLDLSAVAHARVGTFSGGMKRRLDLALALLHQPRLLVLDEPSAGLDIQARELVWSLLRDQLKTGCAILLASHDFQEIDALAHSAVVLKEGHVVARGETGQLRASLGATVARLAEAEFMQEDALLQLEAIANRHFPSARTLCDQDLFLALPDCPSLVEAHREISAAFTSAGRKLSALQLRSPTLEDVYRFALGGLHAPSA